MSQVESLSGKLGGKVKPFVVACIPAFNEEKSIAKVVSLASKFVDRVIVCDDGSKDLTADIAERMGAFVIHHAKNSGYGASLQSLFKEATKVGADIAVTLDADGQHDPEEIPRFVDCLKNGVADIVFGSRFLAGANSEAPGWRANGIRVISELASNNGVKVTDAQSGYRAYNKKALNSICLTESGMGASTEILLKAGEKGLKVAEVPVNIKYFEDSSTHNPVIHGLDVLLTTLKHLSIHRPLLFYGLPGFLSLLIALSFWIWTIEIFASTRTISTNIAIVAMTATVVGLMLLTTSIILWVLISVVKEKN